MASETVVADERTTISASKQFAGFISDLAKEAGVTVRDFVDKHYLPDAKRRHEKMLRRKLNAHELGENGGA